MANLELTRDPGNRRLYALGLSRVDASPAGNGRERYALADGERELAVLDGKGWAGGPSR